MIIDLKQIRSLEGTDFVFSTPDNPNLYTAQVRFNKLLTNISLFQNDEPVLSLSYNINDIPRSFIQSLKMEGALYCINNPDGETCGEISYKTVRSLFRGYSYNQIIFNSEVYVSYTVGMGKKGIFECIYSGNQLIAMIEKHPVVYNNLDTYKIYIKDNKHMDMVCLFAVYIDHTTSSSYTSSSCKSRTATYEYTLRKEIKDKYDPNFKELCK